MMMNLCTLSHDTKTRTEYIQSRKALVGNRVYLDNRFWEIERVDFPGVDSELLKDGRIGLGKWKDCFGRSRNSPLVTGDQPSRLVV